EEVQLEQHLVRVEDEDLPQARRGDLIQPIPEAAAREAGAHLLVARAAECHMVQRPGRTRAYLAVVVARGVGAVEVQDGAAGVIVHPARILARQWRRGVAR